MPNNLKVIIDQTAGLCFGAQRAIHMVEDYLDQHGLLYCKGDLIHNTEEMERLYQLGLKSMDDYCWEDLKGQAILFRAHGEKVSSYELASKNAVTFVDTICPIVRVLHGRIKESLMNGNEVALIGKDKHPEVVAILSKYPQCRLITTANYNEIPKIATKLSIFSQTTMNIREYSCIVNYLRINGVEVIENDTICRSVKKRFSHLADFAKQVDMLLFYSSAHSSNGELLFQQCLKCNPNSIKISSINQIQDIVFPPHSRIGITGANSTPYWQLERLEKSIIARK